MSTSGTAPSSSGTAKILPWSPSISPRHSRCPLTSPWRAVRFPREMISPPFVIVRAITSALHCSASNITRAPTSICEPSVAYSSEYDNAVAFSPTQRIVGYICKLYGLQTDVIVDKRGILLNDDSAPRANSDFRAPVVNHRKGAFLSLIHISEPTRLLS